MLATLGFRNDACSAQYIAHCTRTHKSTISRAVTAMMRRQLVERVENKDDRREYRLRLTREGQGAVPEADPAAEAAGTGDIVLPLRARAQGFRASARQDRTQPRPGADQRGGGESGGVLDLARHSGARGSANPESRDSGFDAEPVIGPRMARTRWHRPGMTKGIHFAAVTTISTMCGGSSSTPMQARIGGCLVSTHSSQARFISPFCFMSVM